MFRPLNDHKPPDEVNDYIGDDDGDDDDDDDDETERGEWKIQLVMQKRYISTKNFAETRTIYSVKQKKFLCVVTQKMSLIHFLIQFYIDFTSTRNIKG